jgi:hypothetical protein
VGPAGQLVIVPHHPLHAERLHEIERRRYGKPRGKVARALPVEFRLEALAIEVADHARMGRRGLIRANVQECAALRRHHPLVQIGGVELRTDGVHIERHRARGMRAIHQQRTSGRQLRSQRFHQEACRGGAGDMIQHKQPRALVHAGKHGMQQRLCVERGQWHRHITHNRSALTRPAAHGLTNGAIHMIGAQQFVTRLEPHRTQHRIHALGCVRHESVLAGCATEAARQLHLHLTKQRLDAATDQLDGISLQAITPHILRRAHAPRHRPE